MKRASERVLVVWWFAFGELVGHLYACKRDGATYMDRPGDNKKETGAKVLGLTNESQIFPMSSSQ